MEGQVVTPQSVTVPAGSTSANFVITAPQVNALRYVLVQGSYGPSGGMQATSYSKSIQDRRGRCRGTTASRS